MSLNKDYRGIIALNGNESRQIQMKVDRFADHQGMVANTEAGLQEIMDRLVTTAKMYDMKINVKKTKVMKVSRKGEGIVNILIEGQKVEQVATFKYLGSIMSEDGRCVNEIRARIAMANDAFTKRRQLFVRKMSRRLKKRIIKTVVWSVLLYGAEIWTLRKEDVRRLNADLMKNGKGQVEGEGIK